MTDVVNSQTRSRMMAGIRSKNTKPELALRFALHAAGFRYRLHAKTISGKLDIAMPKYKAVIFVNGCFWHRHQGCRYSTTPSTRQDFWQTKFDGNVARDRAVRTALMEAGWRVATVWECGLRNETGVATIRDILVQWLQGVDAGIELGAADIWIATDPNYGATSKTRR